MEKKFAKNCVNRKFESESSTLHTCSIAARMLLTFPYLQLLINLGVDTIPHEQIPAALW